MTWKEAIEEEKGLSKCRKDKDHDLCHRPGPPAEFRRVSRAVALEWAVTESSAMAASTGCTRNAVRSSAWQRTLITIVHGARELHTAWTADHKGKSKVQVKPIELKVVASSCYLGDMLSAADGCDFPTTICLKTAWKKFKELLPVLSSRHLSFKTRGHVCRCCV